ncbi:MAG TPA: PQQ-binding-like beta-propeller repeat protein [Solirubrobacterales bacterium]|nr:PQQ-binding-like beta-propeller repeat protein [Solirubrobacterales bacterium]
MSDGDIAGGISSPYANVDLANTRSAPSSIDSGNANQLEPAWSLSQREEADDLRYIASPAVDKGVVYLQDPSSNVEAVDLASGELLWERRYEEPVSGPNGVIVADGLVFGATKTSAVALDAETGEELWSTELVRNGSEQIAMAPGHHGGRVFVSTATMYGEGDEVGVLWALDARTGRKLWHFDTVPRGLWGKPEINYGGGVDFSPAFDGEGSLYVGISNPGPIPGTEDHPWGSSRPGPNLYSNSIVKLNEKTGEVEWHYQLAPHGVCTGGLGPPILAEADGRELVIGMGMQGIVVGLDRETGKLLWRQPVGIHNGHDNDGVLAMRGEFERLEIPAIFYPGLYGGVFGPAALRGSTVFVPVTNGAVRVSSQTSLEPVGPYKGELVALDVATGAVEWKHRFPAPVFGPTTVSNDLVFASALNGVTAALDARSGEEVWRAKLPGHTEGGMTIAGDVFLARTGSPGLYGEMPKLLAYRLAG